MGAALRWKSIQFREEYKYSLSLHDMETGDDLRPFGPPGSNEDLTLKVMFQSVLGIIPLKIMMDRNREWKDSISRIYIPQRELAQCHRI